MRIASLFSACVMILATNIQTHVCKQMVPAIFIFGDSLVDVGNNNYLPLSIAKANYPHHGIDFVTHNATGRFSNGMNAADALCTKLGISFPPAYLSIPEGKASLYLAGVNFASSGAGIFNNSDQALAQSIPLSRQVKYFEKVYDALVEREGRKPTRDLISKSLFFIVMGSNDLFDYTNYVDVKTKYSPEDYTDLMESNMKRHVTTLHELGAKRFSFVGVGKIGCAPARRLKSVLGQCEDSMNSIGEMYNGKLTLLLAELKSDHERFNYSYFNAHVGMQNMLENPSKYGFAEVTEACCGIGKFNAELPCSPVSLCCPNRKDHMFWDLFHPSEAAYLAFADEIFDGPTTITFPYNVRQLVTD